MLLNACDRVFQYFLFSFFRGSKGQPTLGSHFDAAKGLEGPPPGGSIWRGTLWKSDLLDRF